MIKISFAKLKTLCLILFLSFCLSLSGTALAAEPETDPEETKEDDTPGEDNLPEEDLPTEDIRPLEEPTEAEPVILSDRYSIYFVADREQEDETDTLTVTYTGKEQKPEIVVKNPDDPDDVLDLTDEESPYTVSYTDNVQAGTATVTVFETADEENALSATFTIAPASLSGATVQLSKTAYTYDGSAKKPSVTVTLSGQTLASSTDYTVSYSQNNQVGTAKATVTGKGNYTGTASASFKINLATGKLSSLTPSYNGITVKWSKVAGADKYVLYRSTKKGSGFKSVKTISGNSTFTYKNTGLTLGKTYYYKVRAYSGSAYTTTPVKSATVKPAQAKIKKVSSSGYAALKITWSKVSGANGYRIYRSTSKNGTYKKIATVKKGSTLSYKDQKRTTGKTYYYKVAAYRTAGSKKVTGTKSAYVSGKAVPGKVSISKCSQSSGNVTVKWKKVSGANGYAIYRSTSKSGTYKKVKTVSSSKKSWTNKSLTTGKTYYYKIRAYRTVKGKKVYGAYSAVKSVKVPLSRWDELLNKYQSNSQVNQLIFVKYQGGSKANVVLYNKSGTSWKKVLSCTGYVGKKGIGKTKEGDKKTPTGTFNITGAFGIKSKPSTSLSYTKVNQNLYLCADKSHYNQLIDIRDYPHNCTGEHLIDYPGLYNYGLFLDYNASNTYGKGSAIFMHCTGSNKYTSGCVAVSQSNMLKILSKLSSGAKICIYKE